MEKTLEKQEEENLDKIEKKYPNGYPIKNGLSYEDYKSMPQDEKELKFPYGYISSTGITHEEYKLMPEDERELKYPYGCTVYQDIVTPTTEEQHLKGIENERKMTEDLMNSEGLEVNQNLRDKFPNSHFFPICYDNAIIGINPVTQSVIYDCMEYGYLYIMFCEWSSPKYKDVMYGSTDVIRWLPNHNFKDKVPPTLILLDNEQFNKYWEDLQYPGW